MQTYLHGTPDELVAGLGERVRALRLGQRLTQAGVARRADVSPRAVRALEAGEGSSLSTLVRVLKALDAVDGLDALVPAPTVSPMALLEGARQPRRGTRG